MSVPVPPGLRGCCATYPRAEHYIWCPLHEPPLTVEELRHLRATVLKDVANADDLKRQ